MILGLVCALFFFFFSSRRRHTRCSRDWSSDVCSSDLDGTDMTAVITVGFDPAKGNFVGTWVGSMMTNLWVYKGWLEEDGKRSEERRVGKECRSRWSR